MKIKSEMKKNKTDISNKRYKFLFTFDEFKHVQLFLIFLVFKIRLNEPVYERKID